MYDVCITLPYTYICLSLWILLFCHSPVPLSMPWDAFAEGSVASSSPDWLWIAMLCSFSRPPGFGYGRCPGYNGPIRVVRSMLRFGDGTHDAMYLMSGSHPRLSVCNADRAQLSPASGLRSGPRFDLERSPKSRRLTLWMGEFLCIFMPSIGLYLSGYTHEILWHQWY